MGIGYPFRTKRSNLIFLNAFASLWFGGVIIGGVFEGLKAFRTRDFDNVWSAVLMLLFGTVVYGMNRLFLHSSYEERLKVTEADIEAARRMLYGDKPKSDE